MKKFNRIIISATNKDKIKRELIKRGYKAEIILKENESITNNDLADTDLFIGFTPPVNADLNLVPWIHSSGAGVDNFFSKENLKKNIIMTRVRGNFGSKIAQYTLGFILREVFRHNLFRKNMQNKIWKQEKIQYLNDQNILIVGCGNIGKIVSEYLISFGASCDGIVNTRKKLKGLRKIYEFQDIKNIESLEQYKFIILLLPLTPQTRHIITLDILKKFHQATLINVGRGALIKEDCIIRAIENNYLNNAYLDVLEEEPLSKNSILWDNKNIFITPHIAALTDPAEVIDSLEECLVDYNNGKRNNLFVDLDKGY